MAPIAMASRVALASGEASSPVNASVGFSDRAGSDRHRCRADDLQHHARQEQACRGEQAGARRRHGRRQVAGVVRGVRRPARRVAEGGADRQQEAAHRAVADDGIERGRAEVRLGEDRHRRDREDDREHRERPALEGLHQVVPEERERGLHQHDDDQADQRPDAEQRGQRVRAADAVGGEPADACGHRHQHRGNGVALEPERPAGPAPSAARRAAGPAPTGRSAPGRRDRCRSRCQRRPARSSCRRPRRRARRRRSSRTPGSARSTSRTTDSACRAGRPRR